MRLYPLQTRNYGLIDPIIREWVSENSLQLYTEARDVEIRSVLFCDSTGEVRFQIAIEPLSDGGDVDVHVYEVKKLIWERKATKPTIFSATVSSLRKTLDLALRLVKSNLG